MKTILKPLCGGLVLCLALAGCGGGGGNTGAGALPLGTSGTAGTGVTGSPAAPFTVAVTVNGAAASPDGAGIFKVKAGDTVVVTPSQSANWSSVNGTSGAITLRNPRISENEWASQLVNTLATEAQYTVTANAGTTLTAATIFSVAAGDARNGSYKVFATNGTRPTLTLNLDTKTYDMRDSTGAAVSGSIGEDPGATGTYIFDSSRITGTNTARFRLAQDTVVGAFPFVVTQSATESYAVQPFVASRALETSPAALDGVYNRFGIDVAAASASSTISQFQISGNGATLIRCTDNTIYRVDNCPAGSLQTWTVSPGNTADTWKMTEVANPANYSTFAVAQLGGQKIFLIAGKLLADPLASVFRIGVSESSAWPTGTGYGGSTKGSWGTVNVQANDSTRSAVAADGTISSAHNNFGVLGALGPQGIRPITNGDPYFAMQGAKIFAIVGANGPPTAGYLQINLMD